MSKDQTEIYRTRDLAESAALIVQQQRLILVKREGRICWFLFEGKKACEEISNQFFFGELLVNAKKYHEATQTLKNRIFNSQ